MAIINCQILIVEGWLGWPLWGSAITAVEKKNEKTREKAYLNDKVVSNVPVVVGKVVHCGRRWCCWRWSKRGAKEG